MSEKKSGKYIIYLIFSIFFWSTAATAFKISLKYLEPDVLVFYGSLFSFLILFFLSFFEKKTKQFSWKQVGLGLINPAVYYWLLLRAYSLLPAQEALIINYFWPISLAIILTVFCKEKISLQAWSGILLSFIGLIIGMGGVNLYQIEGYGKIYALLSTLFWAIYWIQNSQENTGIFQMAVQFFWGSLFLFILFHQKILHTQITFQGMSGAFYIGCFEMGVTFVLWKKTLFYAPKRSQAGQWIYLSPFLSLIWVSLITGERISLNSWLGIILIVLGILHSNRKSSD